MLVKRIQTNAYKIKLGDRKMYFKRLKNLREDNDYKQDFIANKLKITRQQYGLYETGKRTIPIDLLIKISDIYNTSIDYIVEKTNNRIPYEKK